jgi:hypothetical protein
MKTKKVSGFGLGTRVKEINFFALGKVVKGRVVFLYDVFDRLTNKTVVGPYSYDEMWAAENEGILANLKNQFPSYLKGFQVFKVTKEEISTVKVERI